ncbi:MAG TPA: lipoprotein [Casimicrobiaceae bacterium]|nr:lipoprotein [Casimicrobiaceae bacterium]
MRRKSLLHFAVRAATLAAAVAMLAACGVKGPLRPPPKSTPAARAPTENPATPPATTSPALPPPSIPAAK